MDMDISMDIHAKSVDMDMDRKFHIHGNANGNKFFAALAADSAEDEDRAKTTGHDPALNLFH